MTTEELTQMLSTMAPDAEVEMGTEYLTVNLDAGQIRSFMEQIRNKAELDFDYMFCLSGLDYADHMLVVYHMKSTTHGHEICVKAKINDRENPKLDTLSDIWRTAELHEREVYDLFGIIFNNHPDLRRLFLTDDWEGWPLRKDYVDEVNIVDR